MNATLNDTQIVVHPQTYIRYDPPDFRINYYLSIVESFLLTFFAELGDKTFIMLIILQLKANKFTIFLAAVSAELIMNIISIFVGYTVDDLLYENLLDHIGMLFFITYGLFLLGASFKAETQSFESELLAVQNANEAENQYKLLEEDREKNIINEVIPEEEDYSSLKKNDNEEMLSNKKINVEKKLSDDFFNKAPVKRDHNIDNFNFDDFKTIFVSMALSEFGDRTQMISMTMGALYNLTGTMLGSCTALTCSCFLGVYLGGKIVKFLRERYLNFILGCLFLFYGSQVFISKRKGGVLLGPGTAI